MTFIPNHTSSQPVPITADTVAIDIKTATVRTYKMLTRIATTGAQMLWANPNGFSAEDIVAALGSDAAEVFRLHQQIAAIINGVNPEDLAGIIAARGSNTYVINEDGTVTVTINE